MITDKYGREIGVGSVVSIPCTVVELTEKLVTLETIHHNPDDDVNRFAVHPTQVTLDTSDQGDVNAAGLPETGRVSGSDQSEGGSGQGGQSQETGTDA